MITELSAELQVVGKYGSVADSPTDRVLRRE